MNESIPTSAESALADQAQWYSREVEPHERALRNYLTRRFPSVEADDVIQESYFKLFRARSSGPILSAKAYLFAIARNTALTVFRRRRLFSDTPLSDVAELPAAGLEWARPDLGEADERLQLAIAVIDSLPRRCREVVKLAALEHQSPAEIARRLGIAESTVYVQLAAGVRKCAERLRQAEPNR